MIPNDYRYGLVRERLDAAIASVRESVNGVSLGEGIAYLEALECLNANNRYEAIIIDILTKSLSNPYIHILDNANITVTNNLPYDFQTNSFINREEFRIYTPTSQITAILNQALNILFDYLSLRGFIV